MNHVTPFYKAVSQYISVSALQFIAQYIAWAGSLGYAIQVINIKVNYIRMNMIKRGLRED